MTRKIAIIGSGIAGLSAAWALKQDHDVTLYERHPVLGMDAFSINLASGSGTQRIDVPMRVVYEAYYPNLTRLYREAAIELEPLEYSGTFTRLNGPTYFKPQPTCGAVRMAHADGVARVADRDRTHCG